MTDMIGRIARGLMGVRAAFPSSDGEEFLVLDLDSDFDDLPRDHTQGTEDDAITQVAVLRLARAALMAIREPSDAMTDAGSVLVDTYFPDSGDNPAQTAHEVWQAMIDAALEESK